MKYTYKQSMSKRIMISIVFAVLLIIAVIAYFKFCSISSAVKWGILFGTFFFAVILIMQFFHIYELRKLHKDGVEFFDDESAAYDEKEKGDKLYDDDYEYGKGDEDFEFLLEDGEYTYDTADGIFCPDCGGKIEKDWTECPICGQSLIEEE